jgi:hypothetical protein
MKRLFVLASCLLILLFFTACGVPTTPQAPINLEPQANDWQQLGGVVGTGGFASLASDGTSNTIAFTEYDGTNYNIRVKKWNGTTWTNIGGALSGSSDANSGVNSPSLALDNSGNPTVAWDEGYGNNNHNIYVRRFNGSSWVNVGSGVLSGSSASSSDANFPSLALDSSGNPVVAWYEYDGTAYNIYVQRFNGSNWVNVGAGVLSGSSASVSYAKYPSLALDSSGNPVVAWQEWDGSTQNIYVRRFNGSSWVNVGSGVLSATIYPAYQPSLALDNSGNPTVAWTEYTGTVYNIYIQRFNGSLWVNVGSGVLSGSSASGSEAYESSLALDSLGNPIVAWYEADVSSYNVYVQQWTGSSWQNVGMIPLDTTIASNAFYPSVYLVNGSLNVAWQEGSGSYSDSLYVKRYVTTPPPSWQQLGNALDNSVGQSATNASITRKSNNLPVVAWQEFDGTSKNVYVKEWSGTAWSAVGGALDRTLVRNAQNPSIATRSDNRPVVAWQENNTVYVRIWNGSTAWVNIGAALDTVLANVAVTPSLALDSSNLPVVAFVESGNILVKKANGVLPSSVWNSPYGTTPLDINAANQAYRPSLALKSDGNPIVAWYEKVGSNFNVYVKEWNGTAWVALGSAIDNTIANNAKDVVLAIRTDNRLVVAWEEVGNIYVKRWTGSAWVAVGGVLDKVAANEALRPALDLRSDNNPVVTWQEGSSTNYNVYVKRWTGTVWANVSTSALDKTLSQTAQHPAIVLKSNNNPIVAWDENDGTSENILVKQY